MKKFFSDFKEFISKGNIMDLAIAVVVGGAFGKIVTSLVNDMLMPLIGLLTGGKSVEDLKWVIKEATYNEANILLTAENAVRYGAFLQTIFDFLIISFFIFVVFRVVSASTRKLEKLKEELVTKIKQEDKEVLNENNEVIEQVEEVVEETLTDNKRQELLLTEIRDLLKANVVTKDIETENK